jgi:hypothetical protein
MAIVDVPAPLGNDVPRLSIKDAGRRIVRRRLLITPAGCGPGCGGVATTRHAEEWWTTWLWTTGF